MEDKKEVVNILVEDIIPNRFQPRLAFDEKELNSLAASIKQHGVLQPLLLRKIGDKYEIIAGERRYKAANIAGLVSVPAIIMETDDNTSAELAVIENVQRKDLNAMEEAQSYKKLADRGLTQEEIAKRIGVNQSTVANKIRLLSLDEEVQDALLNNKISERHARSLLSISDPALQIKMLNKVIVNRLTVKQTEEEIAKLLGKKTNDSKPEEIINLDTSPKMDIDMLLTPQDGTQINYEKGGDSEQFKQELSTINPFQEVDTNEVEKFQAESSDIVTDSSEILDFDVKEELNLDNPASNPIDEVVPSNPFIEEFRQQKQEDLPPIIEEAPEEIHSLLEAINSIRNLKDELNGNGFMVDTEEFDFEDMYQIVIKIKKD